MKEWNRLDLDNYVKEEYRILDENALNNALVVISNLIARASTKWNLSETKLFLCAVTQIQKRDENNWVRLSKKSVINKLEIDERNSHKLREMFRKMSIKSYIQLDGKTDEEWLDGFLIPTMRSTKKDLYLQFNEVFLPFLDNLSAHFTEFYLDYVKDFTHLSSYYLYVYLCSWHDPDYLVQNKKVKKSELAQIFHLEESDYWRNFGTEQAKFDWADFERFVMNPAIKEINALAKEHKCDMFIESCKKVKKGKYVLGYDIHYSFLDEKGFRK